MIRKLMVAMVAATMLVAMSVPAYAQNAEFVPNGPNDETLNFALALLEQECEQANISVIDQKNEQEIDQDQDIDQSGFSQSGVGWIVVNHNTGDVDTVNVADQDQDADQDAENDADVEQENEEQQCVAAILQLQDLLDRGEERNGLPNNS